jgi:hypothetical protein
MITLLITVGAIIAYVVTGFTAARIAQPAIISRHTYRRGDRIRPFSSEYMAEPGYNHSRDGIYRRAALISTWMMIFTWPVYGFILGVNTRIDRALDEADPAIQQRKIKEQQERIEDLERELGIEAP